jgi:chromosome segregation ATPase
MQTPDVSSAPVGGPPAFSRNPVNCPKFVVNMFKAGSGKCRDCGHEWHQHEGVIDRQVADKFVQIWHHNQQKQAAAAASMAALSHKTDEELREEERRAYIASQKKLNASVTGSGSGNKDWLSGDHSAGEDSVTAKIKPKKSILSDDSSEEDFKFYSKEEFMAKSTLSGLPTGASSTPIAKPVKVVNLLDFSEKSQSHATAPSPRLASSASPRTMPIGSSSPRIVSPRVNGIPPLGGSMTPGSLSLPLTAMHLRQPPNTGQSPREDPNAAELEFARRRVAEMEAIVEKNKDESRKLLDQLDAAMKSNTDTVQSLQNEIALKNQRLSQLEGELSEVDQLKANLEEVTQQRVSNQQRITELETLLRESNDKQGKLDELETQLAQERISVQQFASRVQELERKLTQAVQEADMELKDQLSSANFQIQELTSKVRELVSSEEAKDVEFHETKSQLEGLKAQLREGEASIGAATREYVAEIEGLKTQISDLIAQKTDLETHIASLGANDGLIAELRAQIETFSQSASEARQLTEENSHLKQSVHEQQARIETLEAQIRADSGKTTIADERIAELEARLQANERLEKETAAKIESLEAKLIEESEKNVQLSQSNTEFVQSMTLKDQRLAELEAQRSDEDYLSQIKELTAKIQDQDTQLEALRTTASEAETLRQSLSEHKDRLEAVETELRERVENDQQLIIETGRLREELLAAKGAHAQSHEYISQLDVELESTKEMKTRIESELMTAAAEIAKLQDKLSIVEASSSESLVEIEAKLSELREANTRLTQERSDLCQQVSVLQSDSQNKEAMIDSLSSDLNAVRTQLDSVETQLTAAQLRLEEETNLRAQAEHGRASIESSVERTTAESESLRTSIEDLRTEVETLRREKEMVVEESKEKSVKLMAVESSLSTSEEQVESLKASLMTIENELKFVKSQQSAESDVTRAETVRITTEFEVVNAKLAEAQSELAKEVQNNVSAQARILQAERTVEDLKSKLQQAQTDLAEISQSRTATDEISRTSEQYLRAIQDASFVIKTVSDKFLSPNPSESNSRAISVEEEGVEAISQLDRHVKALLRLVEAVADKAKILERENVGLENKLRDYESINSALREKANQSFVQKIMEPIISCKWSNPGGPRFALSGAPIQSRRGGEMSQLISPPRQHGGMSP